MTEQLMALAGPLPLAVARFEYELARADYSNIFKDEQLRQLNVAQVELEHESMRLRSQNDELSQIFQTLRRQIELLDQRNSELMMEREENTLHRNRIEADWRASKSELNSIMDENLKLRENMRALRSHLDAAASWDDESRKVTLSKPPVTVNDSSYFRNELYKKELELQKMQVRLEKQARLVDNRHRQASQHNRALQKCLTNDGPSKATSDTQDIVDEPSMSQDTERLATKTSMRNDIQNTDQGPLNLEAEICDKAAETIAQANDRTENAVYFNDIETTEKTENDAKDESTGEKNTENFFAKDQKTKMSKSDLFDFKIPAPKQNSRTKRNFLDLDDKFSLKMGKRRKKDDSPLFNLSPVKDFTPAKVRSEKSFPKSRVTELKRPVKSDFSMTPLFNRSDKSALDGHTKKENLSENTADAKLVKLPQKSVRISQNPVVHARRPSIFDDDRRRHKDSDQKLFSPITGDLQQLEKQPSPKKKANDTLKKAFQF